MMIGRPCSTGAAATEKEWSSDQGPPPHAGRSGAISFASSLNPLDQHILDHAHVPYVLVDPDANLPEPSVATVVGRRGLWAMRHLPGLSHRRIAVIDRSVAMLCSRARIDGYRAVLESAGVEVDPTLIRNGRRIWKASA
jgi:DNA-binding LacI/PurR family transcriptional regulator